MLPLPIVDRELRVAARRPRTHRIRLAAALASIGLAALIFALQHLSNGGFGPGTTTGTVLFGFFFALSFAFTGMAGVFLTADCISDEKREGTLGLLFLTDLHGHDVVLGKLFSHSLQAGYALLAAFPVISTCFLLGGVTGDTFWKLMLLLLNSLILSLSTGVLISTLCHDAQKAVTCTLLSLLFLYVGLPGIDAWIENRRGPASVPVVSWLSPTLAAGEISIYRTGGQARNFWTCMASVAGLSTFLLLFATLLAPRTWQSSGTGPGRSLPGFQWRQRWGRVLRNRDPLAWVALRTGSSRAWTLGLLLVLLPIIVIQIRQLASSPPPTTVGPVGVSLVFPILVVVAMLLLKLWLVTQACRYIVDGRKSGAFELLLVTPARPSDIVNGHWRALLRTFLLPILLLLLLEGLTQMLNYRSTLQALQGASAVQVVDPDTIRFLRDQAILSGVGNILNTLSTSVALCWFGMWMGLTSNRLNVALLKTFAFADFLPWFICGMISMIAIFVGRFTVGPGTGIGDWLRMNLHTLISGFLPIVADIVLILIARNRLRSRFLPVVTGDPSP
jgi:ABC-type transport system involved in multi-copper enzyme maturation permease subunit